MIKKLLSSFLMITSVGVINSSAQALCTTDVTCVPTGVDHGICPDSATNIPAGTLNQAYTVTMSILTPAIFIYMGAPVNISRLALTDVQVKIAGTYVPLANLGLTYEGSGTNTPSGGVAGPSGYTMTKFCYWDAPSSSCVLVSGTPNATGDFPIRIISKVRVEVLGQFTWQDAPINDDYHLLVNSTGIASLDLTKFDVTQNKPNPFTEKSEIQFSAVNSSDVEFKVYNLLGSVVYASNFKSVKGTNTISLEANSFSPGVYMYSVKNGNTTITKRMVVSNK